MDDLHGWPVVAVTPVSVAALREMMDMFNPSHPCHVTLGFLPDSPMFVDAARLHVARARLSSSKRYLRTSSILNDVCDVWDRYRGFVHGVDRDEPVDSR